MHNMHLRFYAERTLKQPNMEVHVDRCTAQHLIVPACSATFPSVCLAVPVRSLLIAHSREGEQKNWSALPYTNPWLADVTVLDLGFAVVLFLHGLSGDGMRPALWHSAVDAQQLGHQDFSICCPAPLRQLHLIFAHLSLEMRAIAAQCIGLRRHGIAQPTCPTAAAVTGGGCPPQRPACQAGGAAQRRRVA